MDFASAVGASIGRLGACLSIRDYGIAAPAFPPGTSALRSCCCARRRRAGTRRWNRCLTRGRRCRAICACANPSDVPSTLVEEAKERLVTFALTAATDRPLDDTGKHRTLAENDEGRKEGPHPNLNFRSVSAVYSNPPDHCQG